MRNLASIQKISYISSLDNSDNLEVARVLGWNVVVKKGEFKPGDIGVYCEIDSILPDHEIFEIRGQRKLRIKTVRLRSQISQGILFNLGQLKDFISQKETKQVTEFSIVDEVDPEFPFIIPSGIPYVPEGRCYISIGQDLTEYLGVTKYDPEALKPLPQEAKGNFPVFLEKTDEVRLQSIPWVIEQFTPTKENPLLGVEKYDGQSLTIFRNNDIWGLCSRNLELKLNQGGLMIDWFREQDISNRLSFVEGNFALQGEFVGFGLCGNKYKLKDRRVYFFNYYNIDTGHYWGFNGLFNLCQKAVLNVCPVVYTQESKFGSVDDVIKLSEIKSSLNRDIWAEGIVWRDALGKTCNHKNLSRISFKVINPNFLLKYDE